MLYTLYMTCLDCFLQIMPPTLPCFHPSKCPHFTRPVSPDHRSGHPKHSQTCRRSLGNIDVVIGFFLMSTINQPPPLTYYPSRNKADQIWGKWMLFNLGHLDLESRHGTQFDTPAKFQGLQISHPLGPFSGSHLGVGENCRWVGIFSSESSSSNSFHIT